MARIRIVREDESVQAEVGAEVDVDAAEARRLTEAGVAERVIPRDHLGSVERRGGHSAR